MKNYFPCMFILAFETWSGVLNNFVYFQTECEPLNYRVLENDD